MVLGSAIAGTPGGANEARPTALVRVHAVRVRRGEALVLDIPALEIPEGEILAVIGPNGAGKSTLLHTLALLLPASEGEISFGGRIVKRGDNLVQFRRRMAVVFQEPLLLDCSVRENVATGLKLRGVSKREAEERAAHWMKRFGVDALANRAARQISGGEAQRVSLARAFALEPDLLLLDEPFSALDAPTRAALFEDFERVLRDSGITTVFVTHDRTEAMRLGDRIAVVMGGRIAQIGEPGEVFSTPASQEVATFVGMENILAGQVTDQKEGLALVTLRGGTATIEATSDISTGQRVLACLRPEDVVVAPIPPELAPSSARNRLRARITRITPLGSQSRLSLDCGFPLEVLITSRSAADLSLRVGLEVLASFKATAVHLLSR